MGGRFRQKGIDVARTFVETSLARLDEELGFLSAGDVPALMNAPPLHPDDEGYLGWKPIASRVTDAELDALQEQIGMVYPPLYRSFLQARHFVELLGIGVRFFEHPVDQWQAVLRDAYRGDVGERIASLGLIAFGSEALMDAGHTCFDTNRRLPNGDCPVVFWDHEWENTDNEVQPMFSSAEAMFRCLTFLHQQPVNILSHLEEFDAPDELPAKRTAMAAFLALDPEGAGGPARAYWTGWGVTP